MKLALVGNPNTGKTSLFNQLTGLRQRVGNYPGITVEKKTGFFTHAQTRYTLYDLPGTYSLYPSSADEEITFRLLNDTAHPDHPHAVLVVVDATQLKRSLLLFEQVYDTGLPVVMVVNMVDEAAKQGITINPATLAGIYRVPVVLTNARKAAGIDELKNILGQIKGGSQPLFTLPAEWAPAVNEARQITADATLYAAWYKLAAGLNPNELTDIRNKYKIIPRRLQVQETLARYRHIDEVVLQAQTHTPGWGAGLTPRLDKWFMHPFWGYVIFALILLLVFEAIFTWAQWPMDVIEAGFTQLSAWADGVLPKGPLKGLVTDGIIPGIGGIVIFIPQIFFLFLFLLILEESGYMSRVVFLMDRWMRPFGLNGKSVVPLMSGAACAIPAVMAARNIENTRERLITILVTPFMTCSARLPVYSLMISLVIPPQRIFGFIQVQALVLLALYALGIAGALGFGWVLSKFIRSSYKSYLVMELPAYKTPIWKNVFLALREKVLAFVFGAGKIILAISIVLWVLSSFGPGRQFNAAEEVVLENNLPHILSREEMDRKVKAHKLEHSYLGIAGKWIEPVMRPLGFDWKMSVGILASFAAREVFVPTMATIYSMADADETDGLRNTMQTQVNHSTGKPVYNLASGTALLLFYVFAMMCMSTFAAVKRETKTWKWPVWQFVIMGGMAYLAALTAYQLMA